MSESRKVNVFQAGYVLFVMNAVRVLLWQLMQRRRYEEDPVGLCQRDLETLVLSPVRRLRIHQGGNRLTQFYLKNGH